MSIYRSDNVFQRLDLSLLRHFFAIASFGGFSKASRATGVSQPALSLGLKKLEKILGTQLIDRRPGNFVLTDSGRVVHDYCRRLEGTLESMVGDLGSGTLSVPRRIRIGTGLSVGFGPLVRACSEASRARTPIELELTAKNTYALLSDVSDGSLDAAIVPDDVYDKRLKIYSPLSRQAGLRRGPSRGGGEPARRAPPSSCSSPIRARPRCARPSIDSAAAQALLQIRHLGQRPRRDRRSRSPGRGRGFHAPFADRRGAAAQGAQGAESRLRAAHGRHRTGHGARSPRRRGRHSFEATG